jgi:site-specific DNA-methyltransferase (adenine-specific)
MAYIPKSKSDKWGTPVDLYNKLNSEFEFNFDPCPIDWDGGVSGLDIEWGTSTFCNPPYSSTAKWIEKAYIESQKGKNVVMLINAITDTKAFHKYIYGKAEIRFLKGRLKFLDYSSGEPVAKGHNVKPSMIVIFKNPHKYS